MGIGNIKNIKQPLHAAVFPETAVERVEDDIGAREQARHQDAQVALDIDGGRWGDGLLKGVEFGQHF